MRLLIVLLLALTVSSCTVVVVTQDCVPVDATIDTKVLNND